MQKSTTLSLAISMLLLVSCAPAKVVEGFAAKTSSPGVYEVRYFTDREQDYVYKANIAVYGNELTGIFIAKKIDENTHRVVFTTEFGNKLMDFEVSENEFKVNSIVAELDRKIIRNTLRDDFRLLLKRRFDISAAFENPEAIVYKSVNGKIENYLFTSKADGQLLKIVQTSTGKEKINLSFTAEKNIFAERIIIQHQNIKLRIEFNHFKTKTD